MAITIILGLAIVVNFMFAATLMNDLDKAEARIEQLEDTFNNYSSIQAHASQPAAREPYGY